MSSFFLVPTIFHRDVGDVKLDARYERGTYRWYNRSLRDVTAFNSLRCGCPVCAAFSTTVVRGSAVQLWLSVAACLDE
jgi:hypothetical protein